METYNPANILVNELACKMDHDYMNYVLFKVRNTPAHKRFIQTKLSFHVSQIMRGAK